MPQYIYRLVNFTRVPSQSQTTRQVTESCAPPRNPWHGLSWGRAGGFQEPRTIEPLAARGLQRFRCAIGVSLFERFLLRGRRQVAGEIRREFDFAHSLRYSSQPSLGTSARYL